MANDYVTVDQLQARIGIEATDPSETPLLTIAAEAASRQVDAICGRRFYVDAVASTRVFRTRDPYLLQLPPGSDISTTTGLVVAVDRNDDGVAEETWAASDYLVDPENQIGPTGEPWPVTAITSYLKDFPVVSRHRPVFVTAAWGWPTAPPPAVVTATLIAAAELWKLKDAPLGVAGFGEYGAVRVRANPKVVDLLAPYRRGGALVGMA